MTQILVRRIDPPFNDRGTTGSVVSSTPRPKFTPGKELVPFQRRLGGRQGLSGWAENLSHRDYIPDRLGGCSSVAIPTELIRPTSIVNIVI